MTKKRATESDIPEGLRAYITARMGDQLTEAAINQKIEEELQNKNLVNLINIELRQKIPNIVNDQIEKAKAEIREAVTSDTKKIADDSLEDLRQKIERDRMNTIQATSIVTIFIGFLVVQFNILQGSKPANELAGLSLMLLSSIIIFVILIDLVIKLDLPYKKVKIIEGSLSSLAKALNVGRREVELNLTWNPKTWGEGLQIRAVMLSIALLIGILGTILITL